MTITTTVRLADVADADAIGQLLHDFNTEFDEPTPGPQAVVERVCTLLADGEITVFWQAPARTDWRCCASAPRCGRPRSTATSRNSTSSPISEAAGSDGP